MVVQTVNKLVEVEPWVLFDDQIKKRRRPVLRVDVAVRRPPRRRAGDLRVWNIRVRHFVRSSDVKIMAAAPKGPAFCFLNYYDD